MNVPEKHKELASDLPKPLVGPDDWSDLWADFVEWAYDDGYDESYFNRWDSKSYYPQVQYIDEKEEFEKRFPA